MKRYKQFFEAKQVGLLYHYTTLENLIDIINENVMRSSGIELAHKEGISFTRNKMFHKIDKTFMSGLQDWIVCRITVNGNKLSNNYKIRPVHWHGYEDQFDPSEMDDQFEERIMAKQINGINKYIMLVEIDTKKLNDDFYKYNGKEIDNIMKKNGIKYRYTKLT